MFLRPDQIPGITAEQISFSGSSPPLNGANNVQDALESLANTPPNDVSKVSVAGDTMTGFLTLHANPSNNFHAATKQYADNKVRNQIQDGVMDSAPSENAVFDALALKADASLLGNKAVVRNTSGSTASITVSPGSRIMVIYMRGAHAQSANSYGWTASVTITGSGAPSTADSIFTASETSLAGTSSVDFWSVNYTYVTDSIPSGGTFNVTVNFSVNSSNSSGSSTPYLQLVEI